MSEVQGFESAIGRLTRMRERAANPHEPLENAARIIGETIHQNFESGGRPAWKPHAESTRRSAYGPSRLLIRSGALENSFTPFVTKRTAGQRSSTKYGMRQNYGYPGGKGRGHSRTPAREFAKLQPEDAQNICPPFLTYVTS